MGADAAGVRASGSHLPPNQAASDGTDHIGAPHLLGCYRGPRDSNTGLNALHDELILIALAMIRVVTAAGCNLVVYPGIIVVIIEDEGRRK